VPQSDIALRVATYNVHRCVGRDGRFDPDRVARVLGELAADVVALQELQWRSSDALHLLDRFAAELGQRPIPGPTLLRPDGHYGNALLTRLPVDTVRMLDLTVPGHEPRGAIDALLSTTRGVLRVVTTHLGLMPGERRLQLRRLLAHLEEGPQQPTVLMGDINEWFLWGRPLRWLHKRFGHTPAPATFPACRPLFALDRIWIWPRDRLRRVLTHDSQNAREASDHLPLVAQIDV
jgi:endonuclease/exonuclease/phosphatase family metal-dependent hydrolase